MTDTAKAAPQGEEIALAQHARRGALVERLGTVADLLCENPLPGDIGDAAYGLLRQAAAQIASDRKRLAPAAIASGQNKAECTCRHPIRVDLDCPMHGENS